MGAGGGRETGPSGAGIVGDARPLLGLRVVDIDLLDRPFIRQPAQDVDLAVVGGGRQRAALERLREALPRRLLGGEVENQGGVVPRPGGPLAVQLPAADHEELVADDDEVVRGARLGQGRQLLPLLGLGVVARGLVGGEQRRLLALLVTRLHAADADHLALVGGEVHPLQMGAAGQLLPLRLRIAESDPRSRGRG